MANPIEGGSSPVDRIKKDYCKRLEMELKAPLTQQIQEAVGVVVDLGIESQAGAVQFGNNFAALSYLLNTLPIMPWGFPGPKSEALDMSKIALGSIAADTQRMYLAQSFLAAVSPTGNISTTVDLNGDIIVVDPQAHHAIQALKKIFVLENRTDRPEEFIEEGQKRGTQKFLDALSLPDKPLLFYKRGFAERVMLLTPTYNNKGVVGSLPTRVTGVKVQYLFPSSVNNPTVSLEIAKQS